MHEVPYFLWWDGTKVSEDELRAKLRSDDPAERAEWAGRVLREARYRDVWRYLSVDDVVRDWPRVKRHLGRKRAMWEMLLDGWRHDGFIA